MQYCEKQTEKWGKVLWVTTDYAEVGIALEFGIRVVHLSCPGMENLYYEQPADLSDGNATLTLNQMLYDWLGAEDIQ